MEKKGRGMENWGVGKCGGWREGRTGVEATVPGQRVLGQMPLASPTLAQVALPSRKPDQWTTG